MSDVIEIMNYDSNLWTNLISVIAKEIRVQNPSNSLLTLKNLSSDQIKMLDKLSRTDALKVKQNKNSLAIDFLDNRMMKLFSDSGAWLEYQAYLECMKSGTFDDVRISTVIDWNKYSEDNNDPTCEIDLIVIDDSIPVFVSCKMNKCTALDLYEVKLLSKKLGGSLGKAAIISKAPSLRIGEPLYHKAKELDIKIIGEKEINAGKIAKTLEKYIDMD